VELSGLSLNLGFSLSKGLSLGISSVNQFCGVNVLGLQVVVVLELVVSGGPVVVGWAVILVEARVVVVGALHISEHPVEVDS
jgi:hypothetical protein